MLFSRAELFAEATKLFARLPCGMDKAAAELCDTVLLNEEFVKSMQEELQKESGAYVRLFSFQGR